jgi:hypothetical protein
VGGVGIATNEPKPGIQLNQVAPGIYQVSLTHVTTGSMKVYSIDGKLLKEFNALAGSQTLNLDLSACEKGIYILQLNTAQGTISRKIIR